MKNLFKLVMFICLFVISVIFMSCGDTSVTDNNTNTVTTDGNSEDIITEINYAPELPDKNYEGAAFRMVSRDDNMHSYPVHTRDLFAETITGDIMNDAVYSRNLKIEERYNVKIELTTFNEVTNERLPNDAVQKAILAGSDEFDLLLTHMIIGAELAMQGYYINWNSIPHIDLSKPYWSQGAVDGYSVGDKLILSLSDMCVSSNDNTHCMLFNKLLHTNYDLENLYNLVHENKWTFDKFGSLTKNVSEDLNGDGVMDENDQFGYFVGGSSGQLNFLWAGGSQIMSKDNDNVPYLDMMSERTISIYEFLYNLRHSDNTYYIESWVNPEVPKFFSENKALFMTTQVGVINDLRNMETDFGILPYPKFDEAQESYGHYVDGHATLMAVPTTVGDIERVGIIIEALSYESYENLVPIYYDTLITTKFTRDDESGEMMNIIYNSRVFDFAYVYDDWRLSFSFSNLVNGKKDNFTSFYEQNEKAELARLEEVLELYAELE